MPVNGQTYSGGYTDLYDGDKMGFKVDMDYWPDFVPEDELSGIRALAGWLIHLFIKWVFKYVFVYKYNTFFNICTTLQSGRRPGSLT